MSPPRAAQRKPGRRSGHAEDETPAVGGEPRVVTPGFHARVYAMVRKVPRGRVSTYGQIATLLGSPRVARHVGWALAALDRPDEPVPWHRVINGRGHISHRGDFTRAQRQRELLEREGVVFDHRDRVDLKRYLWKPRNVPWVPVTRG